MQGKVAKETLGNATVRLMRQRDVVDLQWGGWRKTEDNMGMATVKNFWLEVFENTDFVWPGKPLAKTYKRPEYRKLYPDVSKKQEEKMGISGIGSVNSYIYNMKTGKLSTKDGQEDEFVDYLTEIWMKKIPVL